MFDKLEEVVARYEELNQMLVSPEVLADSKKMIECNKAINEITEIVEKYKKLGELQNFAFDVQINTSLRLEYSVQLAKELDVEDSNLLHNISEIDDFFLN